MKGIVGMPPAARWVTSKAGWVARQSQHPVCLKESRDAPFEGKSIRIARAFLVTEGSEGSDRK